METKFRVNTQKPNNKKLENENIFVLLCFLFCSVITGSRKFLMLQVVSIIVHTHILSEGN